MGFAFSFIDSFAWVILLLLFVLFLHRVVRLTVALVACWTADRELDKIDSLFIRRLDKV